MYLEYKTLSTDWNKREMLADIIGAITGSITTVAGFSASCDKTLTNFVSQSVAPGWTLHDDQITASSYAVIKGTDKDGVAKYVQITVGASGGSGSMVSCAGWNASTHTYSSDYYSKTIGGWDATAATTAHLVLRVWVTARYIIILPYISSFGSPMGILEMPRPVNSAYWQASNGKSCCGVGPVTPVIRLYLPSGALNTGTEIRGWVNESYFALDSQFGSGRSFYPHRNASNGYNYEICTPQTALYTNAWFSGGECGDGLMVMPSTFGVAAMDTTTYGGKTYTVLTAESSYGSLLVPNE